MNRTEKWGKNIQAAGYNGARTVYWSLYKRGCVIGNMEIHKRGFTYSSFLEGE